jgi:phospholipid/cholesterol/gamma-HCH transport system substrate-binding protein
MRYRNEILVGAALLAAVLVALLGVRFLQGVPLLGGGYHLVAVFPDAQGLGTGSVVRVNGVRVGQVERVRLSDDAQHVVVRLSINPGIEIPRGGSVATGGFSALGDVNVAISPGPARNPLLVAGDTLYARASSDLFALLQDNAERLFGEADTLLTAAAGTFTTADALLSDTQGDLRQTLAALRGTTATVDALLRAERARLSATLRNLETASASAARLSGRFEGLVETHADTLSLTLTDLRQSLRRVDASLAQLDATGARLDAVLVKLDEGQGTLGLMLNDPELYHNLNATLATFNALAEDVQRDPARYLRELRLLRIF